MNRYNLLTPVSNKTYGNLTLVLVFLITLVPVFSISVYDQPSADDYVYGLLTRQTWDNTGSVFQTLMTAWNQMMHSYMTWDGNFFATFLGALQPSVFGLYRWVPVVMVLSVIFSTFFLLKILLENYLNADRSTTLSIGCVLLILELQFLPSAVQGLYWFDGAVSYTFVYAMSLVLFGLLLVFYQKRPVRHKYLALAGACTLGFLISGGNFVVSLVNLILLAAMSGMLWYRKNTHSLGTVMVFLFSAAGMLISALAPGNGVRQADTLKTLVTQPSPVSAVLQSFQSAGQYFLQWTTLPVAAGIFFLSVLLVKLARKSHFAFRYPIAVLAFAFCVFAAGFTPPIYALGAGSLVWETRIMNVLYFNFLWLWTFVLFYVSGWIFHHRQRRNPIQDLSQRSRLKKQVPHPTFYSCIALIVAVLTLPLAKTPVTSLSALQSLFDGSAAQYALEANERNEIYQNQSIKQADVLAYTVKPYVLYYDDIKTDKNDWRNTSVAKYYNKDSVAIRN
ncbi:DUF6056 family protein [Eubacterium sp. 1001713B170207_170306_E7]|uniref:DUF6056 family protein n=1 Tax=Eubacterium sp. 1001713B170207_170306_E7 TaxID=2787097 RepID=UPI001898187D|nr:DUF6056 family protein [Eubacterium sp. 1001713B170207_170306_E7]